MPTTSFNNINCESDTFSTNSNSKCKKESGSTPSPTKMWSYEPMKTISNTFSAFKPKFLRLDSTGEVKTKKPSDSVCIVSKNGCQNKINNFEQQESGRKNPSYTRFSFNSTKLGLTNNFSVKPPTTDTNMKKNSYYPAMSIDSRTCRVTTPSGFNGFSQFRGRVPFGYAPKPFNCPNIHPDSPWLKVDSGYAHHIAKTAKDTPQNTTHKTNSKHKQYLSEKSNCQGKKMNAMDNNSVIYGGEGVVNSEVVINNDLSSSENIIENDRKPCKNISCDAIPIFKCEKLNEPSVDTDTCNIKLVSSSINSYPSVASCDSDRTEVPVHPSSKRHLGCLFSQECFQKTKEDPQAAPSIAQPPSKSSPCEVPVNSSAEQNSVNQCRATVAKIHLSIIGNKRYNYKQQSKASVTEPIHVYSDCKSAPLEKDDQKPCTICTAYITRKTPDCKEFPRSAGCQHSIILLVRDNSKKTKKRHSKEKPETPRATSSKTKSFIVGVKSCQSPVNSHTFTFVASDTSDTDDSWDSIDDDEESASWSDNDMDDLFPQTLMNPMNFKVQISTVRKPNGTCASSPNTDHIDFLNSSWNIQVVNNNSNNNATGESKSPAKTSKQRKVQFKDDDELAVVHPMYAWSYAYRVSRRGPWEEYARDRERFRRRIQDVEKTITQILNVKHRSQIYNSLYSDKQS